MVIYKTRRKILCSCKGSRILLRKTRRIGYENQKNIFSQSCLHVFDSSYGSYVIYSGSLRQKHRQLDFLLKGMESLQLQLKIHSVIADGI